ncbi:uncharacterized protein K444DRAFT_23398 [Hyaloscypha bicolor E]|uniref:Uncharacterized protein n=1 Tax=Hyaloscypha bicolor E TaxID=1095630 RepID=A0A2J6T4H1_9HELO|nr:uncharacterized protein K444DRAFT_23398 [Hyaloscypha bicolor E]PMD57930.1 hypothetical protein K444DRAFT_23398 [Hyaloscypha bicolor E]
MVGEAQLEFRMPTFRKSDNSGDELFSWAGRQHEVSFKLHFHMLCSLGFHFFVAILTLACKPSKNRSTPHSTHPISSTRFL